MVRVVPWMASVVVHIGLGIVAGLVIYWTYHAFAAGSDRVIVIPSSFEDPALSDHPGGSPHPGQDGDPSKDAADALRKLAQSDGWQHTTSADMLAGMGTGPDPAWIAPGSGGGASDGSAIGMGDPAPYRNSGGGAGNGPRTSYYGTGGNARKIVYIIDNSGSMVDHYMGPKTGVKAETIRSINNLVPLQYFGVVTVSDRAIVVMNLVRAIPENKTDFQRRFADSVAEGANDDVLAPFQEAFKQALAMKPDLVYFLTDGGFHPKLVPVVKDLNKDVGAKICTLEFDRYNGADRSGDTIYTTLLKDLAGENGGVYRFVSDKDAGRLNGVFFGIGFL